ncbi:flagellar hook protein FlgE [Rhodanobacter sp. PCA2]|uniref:flagellar hook protein FlgE n=1 Tax=Rhodanobacter sp. PCA2 TaxID=2006117 RepID=UPI0015E651F6|nr:flagellar hook protein FlgE [Rhodanobacter sp. PCA2]MBA2079177.1 flagellar hook protein FlgE [Rhodanobacter sp. PCA2]
MALNQALSGIKGAQSDLNVIANNIANANTAGFKGSRAEFADIYAVTGINLSATAVGSGTRLTSVAQQFAQGDIQTTGNSLDLAISGNGFFVVNTGNGYAYTRAGAFHQDPAGNVVTQDNDKLQVYPYSSVSNGFDTSTLTNLNLVTAQSSAKPSTAVVVSSNLPADATVPTLTFDPTNPATFNQSTTFTVYDSLGSSHQATAYYVKTDTNTWNVNLYVDGHAAGTQNLGFDASGALAAPGNGIASFAAVDYGNGANPQTLSINFAKTTQYGTGYAAGTISQDGYTAGALSSIDIDNAGIVTANYSNGQSSKIGQLAMANFQNLQGLRQLGSASWMSSTDSGTAVMGTAASGQYGTIQSGALEESNTSDTTQQLVNMIQAQRNYQANAQVLSTDNTLASTLFNAVSR